MALDLADQHIVVTGGTGGLGTAVVAALLEAGAFCHVPARRSASPGQAGEPGNGRLRIVSSVDLSDEDAVVAFYASLPSLWASIHLAGGFSMMPLTETRMADFAAQLDMNVNTCFLCCREAVRTIRARPSPAGPRGGRILNVAARPALMPVGGMVAYATAKAGVVALTRSIAEEVKDEGILINAVAPSIIDTPANRQAMPAADPATWPTPAQIAQTIFFLISPANALTSGAIVPVYGRA